jgi:hypothetical protein
MKQIILQLDFERYNVLVSALGEFKSQFDKEMAIAEQLKGLVITQWTGSRKEVKPNREDKKLNLHPFVAGAEGGKCGICGRSEKHKLHNIE